MRTADTYRVYITLQQFKRLISTNMHKKMKAAANILYFCRGKGCEFASKKVE